MYVSNIQSNPILMFKKRVPNERVIELIFTTEISIPVLCAKRTQQLWINGGSNIKSPFASGRFLRSNCDNSSRLVGRLDSLNCQEGYEE